MHERQGQARLKRLCNLPLPDRISMEECTDFTSLGLVIPIYSIPEGQLIWDLLQYVKTFPLGVTMVLMRGYYGKSSESGSGLS